MQIVPQSIMFGKLELLQRQRSLVGELYLWTYVLQRDHRILESLASYLIMSSFFLDVSPL